MGGRPRTKLKEWHNPRTRASVAARQKLSPGLFYFLPLFVAYKDLLNYFCLMVRESHYDGLGKMASFPFTWNMADSDSVSVPHNLSLENTIFLGDRPIEVTITDDSETGFTGLGLGGGGIMIKPREFVLTRPKYGQFDGPKYRRTDITRGYVVVLYKPI